MKIYTTIGIYPDGSYKVNGVEEGDLAFHLKYNEDFRPGRALMVDGKIVLDGGMKSTYIQGIITSKKLDEIKMKRCTLPYR